MATVSEIVIGSTGKDLIIQIVDAAGVPVNIAGATILLLMASLDLPSKTISATAVLLDAANGLAKWQGVGTDGAPYVSTSDIGQLKAATFIGRWKKTDVASKVDFGPEFSLIWKKPPF